MKEMRAEFVNNTLLNKIKLPHLTRSCSFRAGTVIVLTILNLNSTK
jgi:hypothetical protein